MTRFTWATAFSRIYNPISLGNNVSRIYNQISLGNVSGINNPISLGNSVLWYVLRDFIGQQRLSIL